MAVVAMSVQCHACSDTITLSLAHLKFPGLCPLCTSSRSLNTFNHTYVKGEKGVGYNSMFARSLKLLP